MKTVLIVLLFSSLCYAREPSVVRVPDTPHHARVIDRKFLALSAAEILADGLDIWTRQRVEARRPESCELNPMLGRHPGASRMALTQIPFSIATNVIAYRMKKSKRFHRLWAIPFALSLAGSAWGIQTNVAAVRGR